MPIETVTNLDDTRLALYRGVSDPELLRSGGLFIAEGRQVVRTLLEQSRYEVRSVVVTETARRALSDVLEPRLHRLTVFLVADGSIEALSGYNIHRGCLALGVRPSMPRVDDWLLATAPRRPSSIVAAEHMANADNMGALFRNAAAFGAGAIVVSPGCCDPLYRKAIRVSMGAALRLPAVAGDPWPGCLARLREAGFVVAALTPRASATSLEVFAASRDRSAPVIVLAGSEGQGLSDEALDAADLHVRIPMAEGMDSINVATAVGIALYALTEKA